MNMDAIIFLIPFLFVFFAAMAVYKNTTMEKQVKARENIQELIGQQKAKDPKRNTVLVHHNDEVVLKKRKSKDKETFSYKLDRDMERANLLLRNNEFFVICLVSGVLTALTIKFILGQHIALAILLGLGGIFLPFLYLKVRIMLRLRKAEEQFADVLDTLVNCFKTGLGFSRAIQVIADNFEDPWGTEFAKMVKEMNLGATQETVLNNLGDRVPLTDVELFVTALIIQKETGGNMAELLQTLSHTCRERFKLYRKVGAISAQGKLSASIIICVPFFLMGMMYLFLPEPVTKFVMNPIAQVVMAITGFWMCCGIGVLFKIVQIEV